MNRVFLSYPSERLSEAREVAKALLDAGYEAWIAADDIPPGAKWASSIAEVIPTCRALICLFRRETIRSPYCLEEVRIAFEHDLPRLTIVRSSLPEGEFALYLNSGQYFFWTEGTLTENLPGILDATAVLLTSVQNSDVLLHKLAALDRPVLDTLFTELEVSPPYTLRTSSKPVRCLELLGYFERQSRRRSDSIAEGIPSSDLSPENREALNQLRHLRNNDRSDRLSAYLSSFWRPKPVFGTHSPKQIIVVIGGEGQGKTRTLYELAGSAVESGRFLVCGNGNAMPISHYEAGALEIAERLIKHTHPSENRLLNSGIIIDDFDTWHRPSGARSHANALRALQSTLRRDGFLILSCRTQKWQELHSYIEPLKLNLKLIHLREFRTKEKIRFLRSLVPAETDIGPAFRSGFLTAFGSCQNLVDLGTAISSSGRAAPAKAFQDALDSRIARLLTDLNLEASDRTELYAVLVKVAEEMFISRSGRITSTRLTRHLARTSMFRVRPTRTTNACRTIIRALFHIAPSSGISANNQPLYQFSESWVPVCLLATYAAENPRTLKRYIRLGGRLAPSSMRQFGTVYWFILLQSAIDFEKSFDPSNLSLAVQLGELVDAAELIGGRAKVLAGYAVLDQMRNARRSQRSMILPKLRQLHHLIATSPGLMLETFERYIRNEGLSPLFSVVLGRFLIYEETRDGAALLIENHAPPPTSRARYRWSQVAIYALLFAPDHRRLASLIEPRTAFLRWAVIAVEVMRPSFRVESFRRTIIEFLDPDHWDDDIGLRHRGDHTADIEAILSKFKRHLTRELMAIKIASSAASSFRYAFLRAARAFWGLAGVFVPISRPLWHRIFAFRADVARDLSVALTEASSISGVPCARSRGSRMRARYATPPPAGVRGRDSSGSSPDGRWPDPPRSPGSPPASR
jgi:hypothetical protein